MGDIIDKWRKKLEVRPGSGPSDVRRRPRPRRPGSGLTGVARAHAGRVWGEIF